jgi:hypothetical protein
MDGDDADLRRMALAGTAIPASRLAVTHWNYCIYAFTEMTIEKPFDEDRAALVNNIEPRRRGGHPDPRLTDRDRG